MDSFGALGGANAVEVDLLTDAYRITGTVQTRFGRVTDILNQQSSTHLTVTGATITEHAEAAEPVTAPSVMVAIANILVLVAPRLTGEPGAEMRIQKRPVRVRMALPPVLVDGAIHVPPGSRPADGLLNMADRYIAVTDASIASAAYPRLDRSADAVAVCRDLAQLILIADEEDADEQLAEVLDERTAAFWLNAEQQPG